jgi:hypothetical protein
VNIKSASGFQPELRVQFPDRVYALKADSEFETLVEQQEETGFVVLYRLYSVTFLRTMPYDFQGAANVVERKGNVHSAQPAGSPTDFG